MTEIRHASYENEFYNVHYNQAASISELALSAAVAVFFLISLVAPLSCCFYLKSYAYFFIAGANISSYRYTSLLVSVLTGEGLYTPVCVSGISSGLASSFLPKLAVLKVS